MTEKRGEDNMSVIETNLQNKLKLLQEIAKANTVKNEEGLTVITKDDPYLEENDWQNTLITKEDK
jgi:hypothetical protein